LYRLAEAVTRQHGWEAFRAWFNGHLDWYRGRWQRIDAMTL
jgi:hypothetical protein